MVSHVIPTCFPPPWGSKRPKQAFHPRWSALFLRTPTQQPQPFVQNDRVCSQVFLMKFSVCHNMLLLFVPQMRTCGLLGMGLITKASEASWSYSCDSKVSFDRVQILTPDFSGRRPPPPSPHLPPSPPPCLPPIFPPSLLPLRKFDSVLSSLFGMRLALRILRPHSLTLTLSLSHCLTVSLISFSSLSSLSPLSLSLLSVSRLSVSLLSLLSQEDPGKEPHIKDSSPLPPKRAPCFFLPRCPPLSHSGALAFDPPWPQV